MSREEVRQAFKAAAATVFTGSVYTTRSADNRDDTEYVSVYIRDGEVVHNFSGVETTASLAITYSKQNATDEQLDTISSAIEQAVPSNAAVLAAVKNVRFERFEYDEESSDIPSITLTYRILY